MVGIVLLEQAWVAAVAAVLAQLAAIVRLLVLAVLAVLVKMFQHSLVAHLCSSLVAAAVVLGITHKAVVRAV
jgi:hypothetical protein